MTKDGIILDPAKVAAVREWARPTSVTKIWSFIGLAGYYQPFVQGFSFIATPLIRLAQKDVAFQWSESELLKAQRFIDLNTYSCST